MKPVRLNDNFIADNFVSLGLLGTRIRRTGLEAELFIIKAWSIRRPIYNVDVLH
jgi:hypothetical protein